jgi:hypothetical protein
VKAKEKAKREKNCEGCTLQGSAYCRECYDFGLYHPRAKTLEVWTE